MHGHPPLAMWPSDDVTSLQALQHTCVDMTPFVSGLSQTDRLENTMSIALDSRSPTGTANCNNASACVLRQTFPLHDALRGEQRMGSRMQCATRQTYQPCAMQSLEQGPGSIPKCNLAIRAEHGRRRLNFIMQQTSLACEHCNTMTCCDLGLTPSTQRQNDPKCVYKCNVNLRRVNETERGNEYSSLCGRLAFWVLDDRLGNCSCPSSTCIPSASNTLREHR